MAPVTPVRKQYIKPVLTRIEKVKRITLGLKRPCSIIVSPREF